MIGAWVNSGTREQVRAALNLLNEKLDFVVLQPGWHDSALAASWWPPNVRMWFRCDTLDHVKALPQGAVCVFMDERNVRPGWAPKKKEPGRDQYDPLTPSEYGELLVRAIRARTDLRFVIAPIHPIGNWWRQLLWDLRHDDVWSDGVMNHLASQALTGGVYRGWNPNKTRWREVDRVTMRYTNEPWMLLSPAPFNRGWWDRTVQPIKPNTWIALGRTKSLHVAFWQLVEDGPHGLVTTGGELTWAGRQL